MQKLTKRKRLESTKDKLKGKKAGENTSILKNTIKKYYQKKHYANEKKERWKIPNRMLIVI